MRKSLRRIVVLMMVWLFLFGMFPCVTTATETQSTDETEEGQEELSPEDYVAALAAMESPLNVSFSLHLNTIF